MQAMAAEGRGTLRLGRDRVDVQCRLATYSLIIGFFIMSALDVALG